MNIQHIADSIRNQWNDERFTPWWYKLLIYFALGLWTFAMVLELTKQREKMSPKSLKKFVKNYRTLKGKLHNGIYCGCLQCSRNISPVYRKLKLEGKNEKDGV